MLSDKDKPLEADRLRKEALREHEAAAAAAAARDRQVNIDDEDDDGSGGSKGNHVGKSASAAELLAGADAVRESDESGSLVTRTVAVLFCFGALSILTVLFYKKKTGRMPWDMRKGPSPRAETKYDV